MVNSQLTLILVNPSWHVRSLRFKVNLKGDTLNVYWRIIRLHMHIYRAVSLKVWAVLYITFPTKGVFLLAGSSTANQKETGNL